MFISFEGTDAAGKTSQVDLLASRLRKYGKAVTVVKEWSNSPAGRGIQEALLHDRFIRLSGSYPTRFAETLLILSDVVFNTEAIILPALAAEDIVVSDRHIDSHIAYQIPMIIRQHQFPREDFLEDWITFWIKSFPRIPDITFLLDVSPEESARRVQLRESYSMTAKEMAIIRQTIEVYHRLAAKFPERFIILDAERPEEVIAEEVFSVVRQLIGLWASSQ